MIRAVALGLAVFLTALPSEAQEEGGLGALTQSPRNGSLEFRLGARAG